MGTIFHSIMRDGLQLGRRDEELLQMIYHNLPPLPTGAKKASSRNQVVPQYELLKRVQAGFSLRVAQLGLRHKYLKFRNTDFNWGVKALMDASMISKGAQGIYREKRAFPEKETKYYPSIRHELDKSWIEHPSRSYQLRQRFSVVLDSHHGGRERTGAWARPDLTVIGGKVLPLLPGKFLDVHSFEVKRGISLQGLYEAVAHRRRSHYAYLMCICLYEDGPPNPTALATVVAEATKQGIGFILLKQHDDSTQWDSLVEPERHEPDPQDLNDFIHRICRNKKGVDRLDSTTRSRFKSGVRHGHRTTLPYITRNVYCQIYYSSAKRRSDRIQRRRFSRLHV